MKLIMYKYCFLFFIPLVTTLNAQPKKFRIGLDATIMPVIERTRTFYGISLDGEYFINESIGLGLETGLLEWSQSVFQGNPAIETITYRTILLAKGRYYLNPGNKIQPYGGIGAGAAFFYYKDGEYVYSNNTLIVDYEKELQTRIAFKTEIGLRFYWINLRAAYNIIGEYNSPWNDKTLNYSHFEFSLGLNLYLGKN